MTIWVIRIVFMALIIALAVFIYLKNKQSDREWRRREKLQEKQNELLERLKKSGGEK